MTSMRRRSGRHKSPPPSGSDSDPPGVKETSETTSREDQFKAGHLVWVKLKQQPWWPAKVSTAVRCQDHQYCSGTGNTWFDNTWCGNNLYAVLCIAKLCMQYAMSCMQFIVCISLYVCSTSCHLADSISLYWLCYCLFTNQLIVIYCKLLNCDCRNLLCVSLRGVMRIFIFVRLLRISVQKRPSREVHASLLLFSDLERRIGKKHSSWLS